MQINAQKLIALRKSANLTADALAEAAGIGRATITRIENGHTSSSSSNTVKKLADVLRCRPDDLAKPPEADDSGVLRRRQATNVDMSVESQNALWLVARRYGESAETILELAPLLFDIVARESLIERRRSVAELSSHRIIMEAMANRFPHMGGRFTYDCEVDGYISREETSIRRDDLRGDFVHIHGTLIDSFYPDDFDEECDNPFVVHIRERCQRVANEGYEDANLEAISRWGGPVYELGRNEAKALAGEDEDLANALIQGHVPLAKMPKELLKADRVSDRQEWIRQRAAETASKASVLLDQLLSTL